jgi:hypothetical protein
MTKECPFCSARVTETKRYGSEGFTEIGAHVECISCGARGPRAYGHSEAERLWNQRRPAKEVEPV